MDQEDFDRLKKVLLEDMCPFFSDEELAMYATQNKNDFDDTAYRCLIVKSMDTTLSVSGLTVADTSKYFRRLAAGYRKSNSGILKEW